LFDLAGHLKKTVGELMATMQPWEWSYWQAYDRVEPIGVYRDDVRSAIVARTVANAAGAGEPFPIEDFLPKFVSASDAEPSERQREIVAVRVNAAMGQLAAMLGKGA
jgi:hypothetical protein